MSQQPYGYININQENMFTILSSGINNHAFRIFITLLGLVDHKNIIQFQTDDIAQKLKTSKEEVIESIKYLLKKRIIELDDDNNYRFNLQIAWRGYYKDHQEAVKLKARKDKMTKLGITVVKD